MSCFKTHGMGVGLTLSACVAMGDPLPGSFLSESSLLENSLLGRFGMTARDLPATASVEASKAPVEEPASLFQLQPERPAVDIHFSERTEPESVGNITIDNMRRRDQEHCLRLLEQSLERDPGRARLACD